MKAIENEKINSNFFSFEKWAQFWGNVAANLAKDDIMSLSAATSFYLALSLSPFLLILLTSLSLLTPELQDELVVQAGAMVSSGASEIISTVVDNMKNSAKGSISLFNLLSLGTLLFAASAVFAQLKQSFDIIFECSKNDQIDVQEESYSQVVWSVVKQRILTIGVVLSFIVLAIASLLVSSFLGFIIHELGNNNARIAELLNNLISFGAFGMFFTFIFHWVPRRNVSWRAAWMSGFLTAFLFMLGKVLIGFYLSSNAMGSFFGAAGSLLAFLIWVYYSALIIFFGAEVGNEIQNTIEAQ